MKSTSLTVLTALALAFAVEEAAAQADKYKRPKKTEVVVPAVPGSTPAPTTTTATTPASGAPTAEGQPPADGEKVDISDLEKRYWAPKDTEFNVVQNRLYSKAGRYALTVGTGPLINDSVASGLVHGINLNYYPSERYGFQATYEFSQVDASTTIKGILQQHGTYPNHNQFRSFYGVSYNWVPFYAKMSLLEKKILYFDMSFSPGIGVANYQQIQIDNNGATVSTPALTFDVSQHFFLNQNFALRIDVKNKFYSETIKSYRAPFADVTTQRATTTTVFFGLTYYH